MPDLYFCNCPRGLRLGWQAPAHGSPKYGNVNNEWKTDCCQGSESHSRGQPFDSLHQCVRFYEGKESTQRYQDYQRLKKKISGGLRDLYKERLEARPAAVLFHRKRWAFEAVQYDGPTWPPAIMDRLPELLG